MVCLSTNGTHSCYRRGCGCGAHEAHADQPRGSAPGQPYCSCGSLMLLTHMPQFHWNDYSHKGYLTALQHLHNLQDEGKIAAVGLVNFDTIRTDEICTQLGPGYIVSNQVQASRFPFLTFVISDPYQSQFSLIDTRPLHGMADVCQRHGVKLLAYGTLVGLCPTRDTHSHKPTSHIQCGGFLADKYLNAPEPDLYSGSLTPSQRKVSIGA